MSAHQPEPLVPLRLMPECIFLPLLLRRVAGIAPLILELPIMHIVVAVIASAVLDWFKFLYDTVNRLTAALIDDFFFRMAQYAGNFRMPALKFKIRYFRVVVLDTLFVPA